MDAINTSALILDTGDVISEGNAQKFNEWLKKYAVPYREIMSFYTCALMEVETKFRVLSEDLSFSVERNPIETIHSRLKTPESIMNKVMRRGIPLSVESIEENLHDIAGVRVVCTFQSDIYTLAESFLRQDDVTLIARKDYFQNPKPNGYRSLHLIVSVPIFLHNEKKSMKVEVQLRTIAMDFWASLEHKLKYKKSIQNAEQIAQKLKESAELSALLDLQMQEIRRQIDGRT